MIFDSVNKISLIFFTLGMSGKVKLDMQGDRIPSLSIWNYNDSRTYLIATYNSTNDKHELDFQNPIFFADRTMNAPLDEPKCGFDGSKCTNGKYQLSSSDLIQYMKNTEPKLWTFTAQKMKFSIEDFFIFYVVLTEHLRVWRILKWNFARA